MPSAPSGSRYPRFGELLRSYRIARGLTQEALAECSGLSVRGISDLERGLRAFPRRSTLDLLIDALDLGETERASFLAAARRHSTPRRGSERASPPPSLDEVRFGARLPPPSDDLVGRSREIEAVTRLLQDPLVRLVTISGPGGVGKTRLATEAAGALVETRGQSVAFVELGHLRDPGQILSTIAAALRLPETGAKPLSARISQHLSEQQTLVVLDSFEHLLQAASEVSDLVHRSPGIRVLATSREPLRVPGEHELPLEPLELPGRDNGTTLPELARSEAVRLFIVRARAADPDFRLSEQNASATAELCVRLDGLPLAIELAAARVKALPPETMVGRLERSLPLLTADSTARPQRQQTLRDTIAWSYDLLREDEQHLFRLLSVFAGGFTLEAAEALGVRSGHRDVFGSLASLVDKSLVRRASEKGSTRFRMLDTTREFSLDRLVAGGEEMAARRIHASIAVALAEEAATHLTGPHQDTWFDRLDAEYGNLSTALQFLLEAGDVDDGLRLAAAIWWFWIVRGHLGEGRQLLNALLAFRRGQRATELRARALDAACNLAHWQGDYVAAEKLANEALTIRNQLGDGRGIASALWLAANVAVSQQRYRDAEQLCRRCLALAQSAGESRLLAETHNLLGMIAAADGNLTRSRAEFERSFRLYEAQADASRATRVRGNLALVMVMASDIDAAKTLFRETLAEDSRTQNKLGIAWCLAGAAMVAAANGNMIDAARLFGATEAVRETVGQLMRPIVQKIYQPSIAVACARLGSAEFDRAWAKGRELRLDAAIAEAFILLT